MRHKKVAVITGGSGVLCSVMALHMAKNGYKVAILGRKKAVIDSYVDQINGEGGVAIGIVTDVLKQELLDEAHQQVNEQLGPCAVLINGAGGNHMDATTKEPLLIPQELEKGFFGLQLDGIRSVFDLNFLGTFLPSQVFGKDMVTTGGGNIINISSMSAYSPLTKVMAYSAAKAAVSNLTEWMAVHFAEAGIRVNAMAPGFFLTNQNRSLLTTEDGSLTERGNTIIGKTPMKRFGKPEELLSTLDWMLDERSSFITGTVIPIDGGFNAFSGV